MVHTGPVSGDFKSTKRKSAMKCLKCKADDVWYQDWESDCGGYEDYHYECCTCGHTWWVEGPDA